MKQEHISELLPAYLDNELTQEEVNVVELHLKDCLLCTTELEEMQLLFTTFKNEDKIKVSNRLKNGFLEALEQEIDHNHKTTSITPQARSNRSLSVFFKVAAAIALLISGFYWGKQDQNNSISTEIAVLKDENIMAQQVAMLSLMESNSASKRIQGVNYIENFQKPDLEIVNALTDRMLFDANVNVRLSATEALSNFPSLETVKDAFIKALSQEKDPGIQIAIIQILVSIQEKKAVLPMQELLKNEETESYVKAQIKLLIPSLI